MFETSVVRARAMSSGYRYRFLTLSLAMHTCAIAVAITTTLISTRLPIEAPKQMSIPVFMPPPAIPPPLGTPHPRATAAPPQQQKPPAPDPNAAPRVIPDQVVPTTAAASTTPSTTTGDPSGPIGVEDGVKDSILSDDTQLTQTRPPAAPIRVTSDMKAPVVIQRVLPDYPRMAMLGHISGWVIVECVIDRTGHVRDAKVLKSSFPAFEAPAVDAVQKWVFSPGMLQGQPVDVIFDLTVNFQLK